MKATKLINNVGVVVNQAKVGHPEGMRNLKAMRNAIDSFLVNDNAEFATFDNGLPAVISDTADGDFNTVAFATKRCAITTLHLIRELKWVGLVQLVCVMDEFIESLEAGK